MIPRTAIKTLIVLTLTLSGCTSIRVSPGPALVSTAPAATAIPPGSRIVVTGAGSIVQKAQRELSAAGYQVISGNDIPANQIPGNAYELQLGGGGSNYDSRGMWVYLLSIGFLPSITFDGLYMDATLIGPDRKVLGYSRQAYKVARAMSLYTPLGLILGQRENPETMSSALEVGPKLLSSLVTQ